MFILAVIAAILVLWTAFAFWWGVRLHLQRLSPEEVRLLGEAHRAWTKTGEHDPQIIARLEACSPRRPGTWRKLAGLSG